MTGLFDSRFYNHVAPLYGAAIGLLPVWQKYIEAVLPWLPIDGKALEIGPGPGWLLSRLSSRYSFVVGLDLSTGMLQQAKKSRRPFHLCQGNTLHLPFPNNSIDVVTSTFTLSAIPDGLGAVREMARVLHRPGGVLALVDAGYPSDGNLLGSGLAKLWELGGDFMRDERALVLNAGLKIIHRREFGAFNSIRIVIAHKVES
ncbi:MAG: class I SAM-dependent methyltransferase [Anaerolineales bacterium]|nr:class I SAM-dependent methyltransferase [Anaerolineales bacterium]